MTEKIEELKKRLEKAKISYTERISEDPELSSLIKYEISAGREKHECILVYNDAQLDYALATNFENFKFIQGFEAIWSKEMNLIEAEVSSSSAMGSMFFGRLQRLISKPEESENEENNEESSEINFPAQNGLEISLGNCTTDFSLLSGTRERGFRRFTARKITLKIRNTGKSTHDNAKDILEKLANSIFFQVDLAFEIPINLQSQRESFIERNRRRNRKNKFVDKTAVISEPKYEYDSEPISLYWYAKESSNMPIFQYLAFYQTIEFYFPIYYSFEAKQKIQGIIKDPRFNPNRDTDITKIISTIRSSSQGKSFGSEREQLKATISACTNNVELRGFFEADENRNTFFIDNIGKDLSTQKISLKNETADLVAEISERIYQIRCRIVHSKASEGEFEVLLPYSSEVKRINFDMELIEFISRKVLITSSRPISI